LKDKSVCVVFLDYIKKIHAQEALQCWLEIEIFKRTEDVDECIMNARRIYSSFLDTKAKSGVNVEGKLRQEVEEAIESNLWDNTLFDRIQQCVYEVLKFGCVLSFQAECKSKRKSLKIKMRTDDSMLKLMEKYQDIIKQEKKEQKKSTFKTLFGNKPPVKETKDPKDPKDVPRTRGDRRSSSNPPVPFWLQIKRPPLLSQSGNHVVIFRSPSSVSKSASAPIIYSELIQPNQAKLHSFNDTDTINEYNDIDTDAKNDSDANSITKNDSDANFNPNTNSITNPDSNPNPDIVNTSNVTKEEEST